MDLGLILAVNAMALSAMIVAGTIVFRPHAEHGWLAKNAPWLGVNAVVVAIGGLALWLAPEWTGIAALAAFVPFVMAPVILFRLSQQQSMAGRPTLASYLAYATAILHPTGANWMNARLSSALARSSEIDCKPLEMLLADCAPQYRGVVQAQLAFMKRDWNEILALSQPDGPADAFMKPLEIRALGELGRIDAMVACYVRAAHKLPGANAYLPQLFVLAFGGRPEATAKLLAGRLKTLPKDMRACWSAIADFNSSARSSDGRRALERLSTEATLPAVRSAAQRQLEARAARPRPPLSIGTEMALDSIAAHVLAPPPQSGPMGYPATLILIALNVAMFIAEIAKGGAEDEATLIDLGGLQPEYVFDGGQWWLVTCMFLHFGTAHIATNMFVLFVLGRILEPAIGALRLAVVYFVGGIASSAFVLWLMWAGMTEAQLLVGASGAIFALFGAEVAIVLRQWRAAPEQFDTRRLRMLAFILVLQAAIDLSIPQVSFSAHASGFVSGLLIMLALAAWPLRRDFGGATSPRDALPRQDA